MACMEKRRDAYRVLVGRPDAKYYLEGVGVDVSIILKWIFKKLVGKAWTGLIWLRIGYRWFALVNAPMNLRVP